MKSKNDRVVRTLASNQGLIESIVSKQQQQHNFPDSVFWYCSAEWQITANTDNLVSQLEFKANTRGRH